MLFFRGCEIFNPPKQMLFLCHVLGFSSFRRRTVHVSYMFITFCRPRFVSEQAPAIFDMFQRKEKNTWKFTIGHLSSIPKSPPAAPQTRPEIRPSNLAKPLHRQTLLCQGNVLTRPPCKALFLFAGGVLNMVYAFCACEAPINSSQTDFQTWFQNNTRISRKCRTWKIVHLLFKQ